jgi:hypothetical protein
VMSAIESCRTVALGGHVMRCEDCLHTQIAYNSSFPTPEAVPCPLPMISSLLRSLCLPSTL